MGLDWIPVSNPYNYNKKNPEKKLMSYDLANGQTDGHTDDRLYDATKRRGASLSLFLFYNETLTQPCLPTPQTNRIKNGRMDG